MPFTKKVPTSKKVASKPAEKVGTNKVPNGTEKPPRGYEYRTFLVKKEAKVAKVVRTQNREGVQEKRQTRKGS